MMTGAANAQMSDSQVVDYVKSGQAAGKTQKQMATELLSRGVTKAQVERIKSRYESTQGSEDVAATTVGGDTHERKVNHANDVDASDFDEISTEVQPATGSGARNVFGRNVFNSRNLTFEPNSNMATPENYKLGPGDEVIIDVWGAAENTIRQTISPEGSISVSTLGPVYLNGMTVKEANSYLQREFSKIYAGVSGNSSQVKLTLGSIRTIQVNIMGEVAVPGTYRLSSFSSVFHALYRAGGVSGIGSLRSIRVMRGGRKVADIDVYDYILQGKSMDDIRLMENDIIIVPPYECIVDISGKVKRPMYYEMKSGETLATLIKYAGGFTGDAYSKSVRLLRMSGREKQIYNVDEMDYSVFKLVDEDAVNISAVLDRYENRVEIRGAVYRDGMYQINGSVNTVKQLIQKAEGLRGDAFLTRAQLQREHDDLTLEMIPIDLQGMMNGTVPDMALRRNDVLYIPSIHDITSEGTLTISGEVARPGTFIFSKNMTIEDLVMKAGGLNESASTARVDVTRRIKDPKGTDVSSTIGETFTFQLNDGYVIGGSEFILEPYDHVYIRRSPAYQAQQNVAIGGEILFGGSYALTHKNERMSDLVKKAGGVTPDAYTKGARLVRKMNNEEKARRSDVLRLANNGTGKDSISTRQLDLSDYYSVGIDLKKALENPGSDYDLVLREGDVLYVPEYENTVKINGGVMYPNTVLYKKGMKKDYYVNLAGGYANRAKKSKCYVIYMNGTLSRLRNKTANHIEPGCEIVVPVKAERRKTSTAEILSMSSTSASMAAVVASLVNLFK
jgi:protein involved in polysaccharide export with SLBB domain